MLAVLFATTLSSQAQNTTDFVTTWRTTTTNESIPIPTTGGGYNFTVNWGDGTTDNTVYAGVGVASLFTGVGTILGVGCGGWAIYRLFS